MSAYTDTGLPQAVDPGAPKVQLETVQPIPLLSGTSMHYIEFSVDVATVNCPGTYPDFTTYAPLLQFDLLSGSAVTPVGGQINPCTDPRGRNVNVPFPTGGNTTVRVGTYTTSESIPFTGSSLRVRLMNYQPYGAGNDASIDNITVLDATPQVSKSFSPDTQVAGLPSRLTFTINNTSELFAKPGWSFTDNRPSGMRVAAPAGASTTCASGNVTATAGSSSIGVTGDLPAGQASCTATVNVTGNAGSYVNGPGNVTSNGVIPPPSTPVTFDTADPKITVSKTPPSPSPTSTPATSPTPPAPPAPPPPGHGSPHRQPP